jgi:hypothetical protein
MYVISAKVRIYRFMIAFPKFKNLTRMRKIENMKSIELQSVGHVCS